MLINGNSYCYKKVCMKAFFTLIDAQPKIFSDTGNTLVEEKQLKHF